MSLTGSCLVGLFVASGSAAWGAEPERLDRDKLRASLSLPTIEFQFSWTHTLLDGLRLFPGPPDRLPEIERLERSLTGSDRDAEPLLRMAELTDDRAKGAGWGGRAETLFRARLLEHPDDLESPAGIVRALAAQDRLTEAEAEARAVLERDPGNGAVWPVLARVLRGRLLPKLDGGPGNLGASAAYEQAAASIKADLASGRTPPFDERLAEVRRAYDRAVATLPDAYDALLERGVFRAFEEAMYRCALREVRGEGPVGSCPDQWPVEAADDMLAAAKFRPERIDPLAMYLLYQLQALAMKGPRGENCQFCIAIDEVPEERRESILGAKKSLLDAASRGGSQAADALCVVGVAEAFFLNDMDSAEKHLRRSVQLEPSRPQGWDALIGVLLMQRRVAEIAELGPGLLKHRASSRSHLIVAKAAALSGRLDEATEHLRKAVRGEPGFAPGHLGLASLAMMAEDSPAALRRARLEMDAAERAAANDVREPLKSDFGLARGIWMALGGDILGAREVLAAVAENPARERAQEALRILEPRKEE